MLATCQRPAQFVNDVYRHCFTWGFVLFFGWVALRYCMHPVRPNFAGFGASVTGFRSYLNYGICFAMVVLMPFFFNTREDVAKLLRWIGGLSFVLILFLTPFVFSKSLSAAILLSQFGLFVTAFDNGWLRFVVLPEFGLNLLMLSFFPNLLPAPRWMRIVMGTLGGWSGDRMVAILFMLGSLAETLTG